MDQARQPDHDTDERIGIRRHDQAGRYELTVDGELASTTDFRDRERTRIFPHTVTRPPFGGRGLAERLVRAALDDARADGMTVIPACWFVAEVIDQHPEYRDLLSEHG